MWARTRVPHEKEMKGRRRKSAHEGKVLTKAPVQPPREVCEREYRPNLEAKTEAEGDGNKSAKNARSKLQLKEGEPTTESK